MTHPALALQEALYDALVTSTELITALGGPYIYDEVPRGKKPLYIVFGDMTHSDWSTSTEDGTEHFITLNIWSRHKGRKEVTQISALVLSALEGLLQALSGHALVNFRHEFTETGRDKETDLFLAKMNFRGVTEPAGNS